LGVKLLFLLPSFEYSSAARQVSLLAPVLRDGHGIDVHVAPLRATGPAEAWFSSDQPLHRKQRRFPPAAFRDLRRLIQDLRPDVVHAWRLPAWRSAVVLRRLARSFRLVASESRRGGRINPLDRWLLRSVDAVISIHSAETDALRSLGVEVNGITELPQAVVAPPAEPPPLPVDLQPGSRVVMCVGNLTPHHAFRDAVWAADVLRYPLPHLHLFIVGDGPDRARIEHFARGVNPAGGQVHFVSARPDAAALLVRADVVWVPSRSDCGRQVLLEAQAAGRPVVATAIPDLASLIDDNRNGVLTPAGDPVMFARRARLLFEDPSLAARIGAAGREAATILAPQSVAPRYAALYASL
jgi:glycosyltransferase involved in cell wall biosynthesis